MCRDVVGLVDGITELRRAHAPLFTARRIREHTGRTTEIARELFSRPASGSTTVDLMAGFTTRYPSPCCSTCSARPLTASTKPWTPAAVCTATTRPTSAGRWPRSPTSPPPRSKPTDSPPTCATVADLVDETLRLHPPAPFGLWRYTTTDIELAGVRLPARSPILVDIHGINTAQPPGPAMSFGGGPHHCVGAQLAQLGLRVAVDVLRTDFLDARLAVPYAELRHTRRRGIDGSRLTALPVDLHG